MLFLQVKLLRPDCPEVGGEGKESAFGQASAFPPPPVTGIQNKARHTFHQPGLFIGLEKEVATHSSTHAWKIPWTEEPGRLQSMGSLRVGHE